MAVNLGLSSSDPPLKTQKRLNLPGLGLKESSFNVNALSMNSEKYISVKDTNAQGSPEVVVIDMSDANSVTRKPMKADFTLMNPDENIMALRGKSETGQVFIQVFDLASKQKLGAYQFTSNESVVYWRWINKELLTLVTERHTYHWQLPGQAAPKKAFDRGGELDESKSSQIIYYDASADQKWCLLSGIMRPSGKIEGGLQLYNTERQQQQHFQGHCGAFGKAVVEYDSQPVDVVCFMERHHGALETKLYVMDISSARTEGKALLKVNKPVPFPDEGDFTVFINVSTFGVVYSVTHFGYLYVHDLLTAETLVRTRITQDTVFCASADRKNGGILCVTKKGDVLSATIDEQRFIPFVRNSQLPNKDEMAFSISKRGKLPGCEDYLSKQFEQFFSSGDYKEAAKICGQMSPFSSMRSQETINKFKNVQGPPGQSTPILLYFQTLLEYGKLNTHESWELVQPAVQQGRREYVEKWLKEEKLTCTAELGDLILPLDGKLGLQVYYQAQAHTKILSTLLDQMQFENALNFARKMGSQLNMNEVVPLFLQHSRTQEVTSLLSENLKDNRMEDGPLQTRLLEINIQYDPQAAEQLFQTSGYSYYDRAKIAQLCERAGMFDRALQHYTDLKDIKRILMQSAHHMKLDTLNAHFAKMNAEGQLECLSDLIRHNRQNVNICIQIATQFANQIGASKIVAMLEQYNSVEGIFLFLGNIVGTTNDSQVVLKYIKAAARLGRVEDIERACKESSAYNPEEVRDFLIEAQLTDPRPLINVCNRHDFIPELTEYLFKHKLTKYIELYVMKLNPTQCPLVIGSLIDLDASEDFILNILQVVRNACPADKLIETVQERNKLKLILPWLEARTTEGMTDSVIHNALARIYIETNRPNVMDFLQNNLYYDSLIIGKFCESRDPHLAFEAYKRGAGSCDSELIELSNNNGFFRLQASYLVNRQSLDLWQLVLREENPHRRAVIDQVVSSALPETENVQEMATTVKAFLQADIPNELIELLERIVLHNRMIPANKSLQNLLIHTAIVADPSRVMDYINRLDSFDAPEIARVALEKGLVEEAFLIYELKGMHSDATRTLLNQEALDETRLKRAHEYCVKTNDKEAWFQLAATLLREQQTAKAIEAYLKAEVASDYHQVITQAEAEGLYDDLLVYLRMARKFQKAPHIDTELLFCLAKVDRIREMGDFLETPNTVNRQLVGDRLFFETLFNAALLVFQSIPNQAMIASCHCALENYHEAVIAARKANNTKVWQEILLKCVEQKEFDFAHSAGLAVIVHPDHLEEVISIYERHDQHDLLIALLNNGLTSERVHIGLYTELGVLYAKHQRQKLMDYIKLYGAKCQIPKLIRVCERKGLWVEAIHLHLTYEQFDMAAEVMMAQSPIAFNHEQFVQILTKSSNSELIYRAVQFYIQEQTPEELNSLLLLVDSKIDHLKLCGMMRKIGHLPLIESYLKSVQTSNVAAVNDALNELYIEEHNFEKLKSSILTHRNFDQMALAAKLQEKGTATRETREIAAVLYRQNVRFAECIQICKTDNNVKLAIECAAESEDEQLAENLMHFFIEEGYNREAFTALIISCYAHLRTDVIMELAWQHGLNEFTMPYRIQLMRDFQNRLTALEKKGREQSEIRDSAPNDYHPTLQDDFTFGGIPALMNISDIM